jgi:nitrogen fixation/metabolism regulation signal transduction histidine kinase
LVLNLGPVIALLLAMTVVAILLLQGVLRDLDRIQHDSAGISGSVEEVARHFRWVVLGLGITFLVVINVSVVVLIRMATAILRPVDKLVLATRELSHEHFNHRVTLEEHDEFDELASAYNRLAEHLQQTEQRRIEVLGQVALALNHELNNAMGTIQLQLDLLSRRAGANPLIERRLHTIQNGMARMKETVQSLKSARRIVLTDYAPGVKMLDLAQSLREGRDEEHVSPT